MFFKNKNKTDLKAFLNELRNGNDKVLNLLNLKTTSFKKVSHSKILDNPSDIAIGVIDVYTNFNTVFFSLFDSMLIKDYDNGDRTYIFYCKTKVFRKLNEFIETVTAILGNGITNTDRHIPITDKLELKNLINGEYAINQKDMVSTWLMDNLTILLQYKVKPKNEFSLFITSKKEIAQDKSVKSKGTILDLLNTDFISFFLEDEESHESEPISDGSAILNKYVYKLKEKELGIFDKIMIHQIGESKDFSFERNTNITFYCSQEFDYIEKIKAVEKLIRLYGLDNSSYEELKPHEIDMIKNCEFWTGRNWTLNERHQLWDSDNNLDKIVYSIDISYDSYDLGFNLSIVSFNGLIEYFKPQ